MLNLRLPEQRRGLARVTGRVSRDLAVLWRQALAEDALVTKAALLDLVPPLGDSYSLAAAALAADWYDDAREVAGARGRFTTEPAELVTKGRYEALIGWAIGPLFTATPTPGTAFTLLDGGLQRIVANAHRDTITTNSVRDPGARGWARAGAGGCDFCRMLIGRGGVYTQASADFEAHDHCHCVAVPDFD